jgi:hypothetical protein
MTLALRRCLAFGPNGVHTPGSDADYRYASNEAITLDTGFTWVRFWALWPSLQPLPPERVPWSRLGTAANPGYPRIQALDGQIARARASGRKVIITSYQFPTWANGTSRLPTNSVAEIELQPHDRMTRAAWQAWLDSGRTDFAVKRKSVLFRIPADLGARSSWARWIRFLYERYKGYRSNVVLELMNEPNLQMWPQMGPSPGGDPFDGGRPTIGDSIAAMMRTAQSISADYGHALPLMAPATDDGPSGGDAPPVRGRRHTAYATAVRATLDELDRAGFTAHDNFMWSAHNYADVADDRGEGTARRNRAAHVRSLLVGRWSGWPGAGSDDPRVFITEGGAQVRSTLDLYRQPQLILRNWERMHQDAGDGAGIEMVAQYLTYTSPVFDSGICEQYSLGGAHRPAYHAWKSLPSNA